MEQKLWYTSKTVWINLLAAIALVAQHFTGYVVSPELQAAVLVIVNFVLRAISKTEIVWSKATLKCQDGGCGCRH